MNKSKLTTLLAVVVLLALGFFVWQIQQGSVDGELSEEKISELNPFAREELANPFQEESANPYENIKTNPFE